MEAVPKLPLISFELKTSPENVHFGPKLKHYIAEAYREDPESYTNEIHQMECLRSVAVRPTMDAEGLSGINKYFCQLRSLQSRFPMAKGQPAAVSFSWKDLYANMSCSLPDIRFEMACILYNIGALHTFLGASEPRNSADSLKAACTHYQNAAWAFQYLKEQYPQPPGVDVSTELMRLMQKICFAQAQECILEKSIQDTRKPSVVGSVATQVLLFYKNALAVLGPSAGTDNIHEIIGTKLYNYWHRYLSFKAAYVGCIVCLYQGMNAEEQQKMGERVAFYQQAVDRLNEARKLAKYIEPVQVTQEAITFTNDVVEGKRKAAKNENEFIYHEEVPEKVLMVEMKPVCLVKALAINFNDPELSGPDVFARLVPICAHEASSMYSEEKAKILRQVVTQAESKNTEITEFMSSLQLDQLEIIDTEQRIPQEIVDRCAAMNAKAEIIQTLVDSMNNLAEIISDVEHSLGEVKSLIQEETMKEKEYQKVMGARPPSIVQTELSRELHKYMEAHARAADSNHVLHTAMTLHIANLHLLALPLDELQAKIPGIHNIEGLDRDTMSEMRRVVAKARDMQSQRDSLIQSLREDITNDDITSQLLARSADPAEEIFKEELEKHTPKVKIIEQNLVAQENIINKLTSLYASYAESRRMLTDVLRKRDGLINALITSYDAHEELLAKSQKGLEFYKKMLHNVNQLLTRLKGTCQVQEEERAQLLAKNSKPSTPTPSVAAADISAAPAPPGGAPRKLKDYLPYMKTRSRGGTPALDSMPPEAYYGEQMYPPSIRPAPLGSEATDLQMQLPDGVMPQTQNPQDRYYAPETDPYAQHNYPYPTKDKPDPNYGYSSPYTPQQYSMTDPTQSYSNSYYSANHNNPTTVTDSQTYPSAATPNQYGNPTQNQANTNPNQYPNQPNQANPNAILSYQHDPYAHNNTNPDVVPSYNTDLSTSFSQLNVTAKSEAANFGQDYTQTYFNVQYPHVTTPNFATYTPSMNTSNANMIQTPSDYSSMNYPYSSDGSLQGPNASAASFGNVSNPSITPHSGSYNQSQYGQSIQGHANPNLQGQMANPNMQGQMANPNMQSQMANPNMQGQMANPNMQGQMANTNLQGQIANPNSQSQMPNSNIQGQLPNSMLQGHINPSMSNPNLQAQTNPNAQGHINPNLQGQMNNPIQGQIPNSAYQGQVNNPSIQGTMATNPAQSPMANPYSDTPYSQTNIPNASIPNIDPYNTSVPQYISSSYSNASQDYPIYTNAESSVTSTVNINQSNFPQTDQAYTNTSLGHLDAIDKPIKSHVTGQALSTHNINSFKNYAVQSVPSSQNEQNYPNNTYGYPDQPNSNYSQGYQNHPGYTFNAATGAYEYTYGSQNTYASNYQSISNIQPTDKTANIQGVYTSAGSHGTLQSPSGNPSQTDQNASNEQMYYNTPYGYITNTNQAQEIHNPPPMSTNYGANVNQSTYMQSGQGNNTNTTNTNYAVSTPTENAQAPFEQNNYPNADQTVANQAENNQPSIDAQKVQNPTNNYSNSEYQGYNQNQTVSSTQIHSEPSNQPPVQIQPTILQNTPHKQSQQESEKPKPEIKPEVETKSDLSTFDLLSDIDFTVETKTLMPEIKVPQISGNATKKPFPKPEPVKKPVIKEEVLERPAKRDIFSDPSLLNQFTQEVKNLQRLTETLTNKVGSGLTVLDSKWKSFQDLQTKENMSRSKTVAMQHTLGNIVTDVVPYDDSRLVLQADPDAYINASHYKQLAPWCIPLVISKNPSVNEHPIFWKAVIENKISCVACLLTEIEMQGKSYWPTAKGQSLEFPDVKVTLEDVICTVHWTERKLSVASGKTVASVSHYQINVFPAKIVCSPLVLLADKILSATYENRLSNQLNGAWIQCSVGAGRSALLALLCMLLCQVRAGQLQLCDMLDEGCMNLCKHRSNVLEDTKYLADAYRTALFYVQGVLCSGTTSFNGEAVSSYSGAGVPPASPAPAPAPPAPHKHKFSRESFEEMRQAPGLTSGDMKDPLNFLDPLWSLKKK